MSYGHGNIGPHRKVVEALSGWSYSGIIYYRKVLLECGHVTTQTAHRPGDINRKFPQTAPWGYAHCYICTLNSATASIINDFFDLNQLSEPELHHALSRAIYNCTSAEQLDDWVTVLSESPRLPPGVIRSLLEDVLHNSGDTSIVTFAIMERIAVLHLASCDAIIAYKIANKTEEEARELSSYLVQHTESMPALSMLAGSITTPLESLAYLLDHYGLLHTTVFRTLGTLYDLAKASSNPAEYQQTQDYIEQLFVQWKVNPAQYLGKTHFVRLPHGS
jgi:hypothetical protein